MNWQPIATIAAPIIAFFIGAAVNRRLERRPKLIYFVSHSSAVRVQPTDGQPFSVHTHTVAVRNAGGAAATNVRLSHAILPNSFSVFPSVMYTVEHPPSGGADILFPALVPGEQISVTYLYFPPMLFSDINTSTKSDAGFAKIATFIWSPKIPIWWRNASIGFAAVGVATVIYALWELARLVWPMLVQP